MFSRCGVSVKFLLEGGRGANFCKIFPPQGQRFDHVKNCPGFAREEIMTLRIDSCR